MKNSSIFFLSLTQRRTGFNLTELAIVLGVIGLVLSLVWMAASTAWEMARREQMTELATTVVTNVRTYYSGQLGIPFSGVEALTPKLFGDGVIPSSMQRKQDGTCTANSTTLCADTPWGGNDGTGVNTSGTFQVCAWAYGGAATACALTAAAGAVPSQFFAIQMMGLSQENCMKLAPQLSGSSAPSGLMAMIIKGSPTATATTPTLPVTPAASYAACSAAKSNVIILIYKLSTT